MKAGRNNIDSIKLEGLGLRSQSFMCNQVLFEFTELPNE